MESSEVHNQNPTSEDSQRQPMESDENFVTNSFYAFQRAQPSNSI